MRYIITTMTFFTIFLSGIYFLAAEGMPLMGLSNFTVLINAEPVISNGSEAGDGPPIDFQNPILKDPQLKVEKVVDGLDFSTSMAFLDSNDIIVLEKKKGTVQLIVNGTIADEPLLDMPVNYFGGRGMLGVAVSDDNKSRPTYVFLYLTLSSTGNDIYNLTGESGNHLYRYEFKNNTLDNPTILLNVPAVSSKMDGGHNGGKLLIGPDQNIYLIVGDLREHRTKAQNNLTGPPPDGTSVIYRITQDGKPVPDNPFGDDPTVSKFYAYGIRNSFGMDFDPLTGKLWDTENGPDYGDEINLVESGFNSGWKRQQGFSVNSRYPDDFVYIGENGTKGKYSDPEFVWKIPVAPTALKFLTSDKLGPEYKNDIFVGDSNTGSIYHFDLDKNRTNLAIYTPLADKIADNLEELERIIFGQQFGRVTDLTIGPDGYLYILTNDLNLKGAIFRIIPAASGIPENNLSPN
jgi:aldose sugar dehydrogenase